MVIDRKETMGGRALLGAFLILSATGVAAAPVSLRVTSSGVTSAFDTELLSVFAKMQGREIAHVVGTAAAATAAEPDVVAGLIAGDPRIADRVATGEVFPTRVVAVTRRPNVAVGSIETMRGSRLGVLRGSRAPEVTRDAKVTGVEIVTLERFEDAVSALRTGQVTCLLLELPEALVAQRADAALQLGVFLGSRRSYVFAARRDDVQLQRELNRFLQGLRSTPSWLTIVTRHFGSASIDALGRARLTE